MKTYMLCTVWPVSRCLATKTREVSLSFLLYSKLATDSTLASSWTSGSDETWSYMKSDCGKLADKFTMLSEKALQQVAHHSHSQTIHNGWSGNETSVKAMQAV